MILLPRPCSFIFPDEKIRNEVAIMKFIKKNTTIPIHRDRIRCGLCESSQPRTVHHNGLSYVEGKLLPDILKTPNSPDNGEFLNLDISWRSGLFGFFAAVAAVGTRFGVWRGEMREDLWIVCTKKRYLGLMRAFDFYRYPMQTIKRESIARGKEFGEIHSKIIKSVTT